MRIHYYVWFSRDRVKWLQSTLIYWLSSIVWLCSVVLILVFCNEGSHLVQVNVVGEALEEGGDDEMSEPDSHIRLSDLLVLIWHLGASLELVIVGLELSEEAIEIIEEERQEDDKVRDVRYVESQPHPVLLLEITHTVEDHVLEAVKELDHERSNQKTVKRGKEHRHESCGQQVYYDAGYIEIPVVRCVL